MGKTAWLACGLITEGKIEPFTGLRRPIDLRWNSDVLGVMPVFRTKKAATEYAMNNKLGVLDVVKVLL